MWIVGRCEVCGVETGEGDFERGVEFDRLEFELETGLVFEGRGDLVLGFASVEDEVGDREKE